MEKSVMLERLKKQSLSKLLIMAWNVLRMAWTKVRKGKAVKVSLIQNIAPGTTIAVHNGTLRLAHSVFTRKGVTFRASGGELDIGTCFFNQGCSVTAKKRIVIGDDSLFGPNVVIVDHDHDYHLPDQRRGSEYLTEEVIIGKNVVVGANSVILKGTHIGDNCIIGAGSVVRGSVPANTLFYNKRIEGYEAIRFR